MRSPRAPPKESSSRVSWDLAFGSRTEIDGKPYLGVNPRVARSLPFEAQRLERRDRHGFQGRADELADLNVSAAQRQVDAVVSQADGGLLEPVLALEQLELRRPGEAVDQLELVGQPLQRGEQVVEASQLLGAALARHGLERHPGAQALRDQALRLELAFRGPYCREIERDAENEHADPDHARRAESVQPFLDAVHRALLKDACTLNWIGREGSSIWTWWLARNTPDRTRLSPRRRT